MYSFKKLTFINSSRQKVQIKSQRSLQRIEWPLCSPLFRMSAPIREVTIRGGGSPKCRHYWHLNTSHLFANEGSGRSYNTPLTIPKRFVIQYIMMTSTLFSILDSYFMMLMNPRGPFVARTPRFYALAFSTAASIAVLIEQSLSVLTVQYPELATVADGKSSLCK
jgi:hypothetical protein